ncbi:hypothetical protein WR25_21075 [Diploscapter pachys]|uniref:Uncharacterized protein n=1 Tax=Diploscapter pachys TaxID=2018661 RepID=A0A2A2KFE2_9BILA|nr:hypothetical protein WR25_21075 [Diploscapter pachys]
MVLLAALIKLLDGKDISPIKIYNDFSLSRSNKSMTEYNNFLGELCMKPDAYADDINLYLQWEERNFLRNIRILLIPETENGDLSSITDPRNADLLRVADYRMFTALEIEDQCPKKNKTANDDNTQYRINSDAHFQDHIIDL